MWSLRPGQKKRTSVSFQVCLSTKLQHFLSAVRQVNIFKLLQLFSNKPNKSTITAYKSEKITKPDIRGRATLGVTESTECNEAAAGFFSVFWTLKSPPNPVLPVRVRDETLKSGPKNKTNFEYDNITHNCIKLGDLAPPQVKTHNHTERYTECSKTVCQRKRQLSAAAMIFRVNQALCFPLLDLRSRHGNRQRWRRVAVISLRNADDLKTLGVTNASRLPNGLLAIQTATCSGGRRAGLRCLATGVKKKHKSLFHWLIFLPPPGPPLDI